MASAGVDLVDVLAARPSGLRIGGTARASMCRRAGELHPGPVSWLRWCLLAVDGLLGALAPDLPVGQRCPTPRRRWLPTARWCAGSGLVESALERAGCDG